MLEFVEQLDHQLFTFINLKWTASFGDWFFPFITDLHKKPYVAVFLVIGSFLWIGWLRKLEGLFIYVGMFLALAFNDWFGSQVIKDFFKRSRPPLSGIEHVLRAEHFNGYSFTSNHAANTFCAAVFVSSFFPKARWPLLWIAALVSYSRVYVGVHFPSDILMGALVGSAIGWIFSKLTGLAYAKARKAKAVA